MTLPIYAFVVFILLALLTGIFFGGMIEGLAQLRRDVKKYKGDK